MKKTYLIYLFLFIQTLHAQEYKESELDIKQDKDSIFGTLLEPTSINKPPLVILLAGSGPTDRNGNSSLSQNNSLRFLADALAQQGIATYRYDKNTVRLLKKGTLKEEEVHFNQLITDAQTVVNFFKNKSAFSKIYIAGHSQGSLIGMIAAQNNVDGFISLSGAGNSIDQVLKKQLLQQAPQLETSITQTLDKLKKGEKDPDFNPMLSSIFRLSIQPYLIDWMHYNPQLELKKLQIPILIINGDKDLQVAVEEARLLQKANPTASLKIIKNMNHILKEIKGDIVANYASYTNPDLPVAPQLIDEMVPFIKIHTAQTKP